MENNQIFYAEPRFILPFSQKKLAEKSYLTFNLRLSMSLAGAATIKTKYFGSDPSSSPRAISMAKQAMKKYFKKLNNFFQQVLSEKCLD